MDFSACMMLIAAVLLGVGALLEFVAGRGSAAAAFGVPSMGCVAIAIMLATTVQEYAVGDIYALDKAGPGGDRDFSATVVASTAVCPMHMGDIVHLHTTSGPSVLRVAGQAKAERKRILLDIQSPSAPCVTQVLVASSDMRGLVYDSNAEHPTERHDKAFARELASIKPPTQH